MQERIAVVVPCRLTDLPQDTLTSLFAQTYPHLDILVVIDSQQRGQGWARNRGVTLAQGARYVLFSDYDIRWVPEAVATLRATLQLAQLQDAKTAYAFCAYRKIEPNGTVESVVGNRPWSWHRLLTTNYISTMVLLDLGVVRLTATEHPDAKLFPLFDEALPRLEDWDLWLRLGEASLIGVSTGQVLFDTDIKPGVSYGGPVSHEQAEQLIRQRHGRA